MQSVLRMLNETNQPWLHKQMRLWNVRQWWRWFIFLSGHSLSHGLSGWTLNFLVTPLSLLSLCFSLPVLPLPSPLVLHLSFQLEKEWKWNMTMRHFFYSCWPNRSRLLNTGWEERIKRRSRRAAGCEGMEVTHSSLRCGTKQRCSITNSQRIPPFFIISNSKLCLSSWLPLLNLLYLSNFPSNLTVCVPDKLFSHLHSPPWWTL